jgi:hypothetical protein
MLVSALKLTGVKMKHIEWLEMMHTLHGAVEILYVVDGYQLTRTYDGSEVGKPIHGKSLAIAIDNAIIAGWKPIKNGENT